MNMLIERARKLFDDEKQKKFILEDFDDLYPSEQQPYFRKAEKEMKAIYDPIS